MAEDRVEPREVSLKTWLPWLALFQSFRVALDINKLVLAAGGIVTMAFGWWLLAVVFNTSEPVWDQKEYEPKDGDDATRAKAAWKNFKDDHSKWALRYMAAGNPADRELYKAADVADSEAEYKLLRLFENRHQPDLAKMAADSATPEDKENAAKLLARKNDVAFQKKVAQLQELRPAGEMRRWPWSVDRGPNPYLLVSGQVAGWEKGHFWDWLLRTEVPVLLEPLFMMLRPIVYFFSPNAGTLNCIYFLLVLFWTVSTWAVFGGAITRIAAVQVARQEKLTLVEAVRFTTRRWFHFVLAPLFPLLFVGLLTFLMILFGFVHMIPWVGELWSGVLWCVMLLFGLLMAVGMVGLVGWPLMSSTISTEGTDSWEAVSRSYSYVFQAPWYYAWCSLITVFYGAIVVFFVGFMGSLAVYLSKWGVSQTPFVTKVNREPSYLFVYTPQSFGWRTLMLKGVVLADGDHVVGPDGRINEDAYKKYTTGIGKDGKRYDSKADDTLTFMNRVGAFLVGFWIYVFFLLILGFGYSFFWSSSAIIYLLMRKRVDDAELDEVYLEEDDVEPFRPPSQPATPAAPPTPPAPTGAKPLTMLAPPTLRPPGQAAPTTLAAPPAPPALPPPATPALPPSAPPPPPKPPEPPVAQAPPEPEPPKPPEPPATPPEANT